MLTPSEIVFSGFAASDFVRKRVEQEIDKLERFYPRINSLRVVLEAPHRHHHKGKLYGVRLHLKLPGGTELSANREPSEKHAHEDVYVAIRDAFAAMRRQLQDQARQRQGQVKVHEPPAHGRVARLIAEGDYGFIESADGREIYFHANSVLDGFERLQVGSEVRFAEEVGEKGPQATTVHLVGKHHPQ